MEGRLYFNSETQRYGLRAGAVWVVDGFHCGEPLEVMIDGTWVKTRIEVDAGGNWYLAGVPGVLYDLRARI